MVNFLIVSYYRLKMFRKDWFSKGESVRITSLWTLFKWNPCKTNEISALDLILVESKSLFFKELKRSLTPRTVTFHYYFLFIFIYI